jgi:hypothetical protein
VTAKSTVRKKVSSEDEADESPKLEAVPEPKEPESPFRRLYPKDAQLFWYQPKAEGSQQIPLPAKADKQPDKLFFFDLDEVKGNAFLQIKRYMDFFNVPKPVSRYAFSVLSDEELMTLCDKWFEAMGGRGRAGE